MRYLKTYEEIDTFNFSKLYFSSFIVYMLSYYGKYDGLYPSFFKNKLTKEDVEKYVGRFVKRRREMGQWSDGDSLDREVFRDFLLVMFDITYNTEHDIRDYLTKEELEDFELKKKAEKYNI